MGFTTEATIEINLERITMFYKAFVEKHQNLLNIRLETICNIA